MMKTRKYAPVILTSTKFLPIFKIFSKYWKQLEYPHKTYVLSNNFDGLDIFDNDNFEYLTANVKFDKDALHFRNTMLYGLSQIKEKYILLMLEDYIFIDAKFDMIDKLVSHMERHDIDYCSLAAVNDALLKPAEESIDLGITSDWVGTTEDDYMYKYSIQPCIWKVDSLKMLIEKNIEITHSRLDTSILEFHPKFKRIYTNKKNNESAFGFKKDDYIVYYMEIMRWGTFNVWENTYTLPFIKKIIKECNITFEEGSPYKTLLDPDSENILGGIDYAG